VLAYVTPPEGGAEFRVMLPRMRETRGSTGEPATATLPMAAPAPPPVSLSAAPASRRILVVDEDPAVHRVVNAVFAGEGYAVDAARTGEQGLQLAAERRYELIVADARVAAGQSQRFVQALLSVSPDVSRSLVVTYGGDNGVPDSVPASVPRIRKPLSPRELRTKATELFQAVPTPPSRPAPRRAVRVLRPDGKTAAAQVGAGFGQ
jgi:two-component system response regulator CpxR